MKIIAGSSNPQLALKLGVALSIELLDTNISKFNDSELKIQVHGLIGKEILLVQSTSAPVNDHLMELLLLADTAKRAGAARGLSLSFPILAIVDKIALIIKELVQSYAGVNVCAGSGLASVYSEIKDIERLIILPRFYTIKALHIARLADDMINKGHSCPIEPLYIRPPDAIPAASF